MIKKILYFWFYFFFKISLLPFKILIKIFDNLKFNKYLRFINYYLNSNVKEIILNTFNNTNVINNLEKKKILNYVDIGSAWGVIPEVLKNEDCFNKIILFDGNENEKSKLEKKGYTVLDNYVSDENCEKNLYNIEWNPGANSLFRPGSKHTNNFFALYGGKEYFEKHQNYKVEKVKVFKVSELLKKININKIDLLKLDVQGSEEGILKDIFQSADKNEIPYPLFIKCEIMFTPFYEGLSSGYEVISLIVKNDYVCVGYLDEHFRDNMPIWSDCLFIPNWNTRRGKEIILQNLDELKLLCKIYNKEMLYLFILKSVKGEDLPY